MQQSKATTNIFSELLCRWLFYIGREKWLMEKHSFLIEFIFWYLSLVEYFTYSLFIFHLDFILFIIIGMVESYSPFYLLFLYFQMVQICCVEFYLSYFSLGISVILFTAYQFGTFSFLYNLRCNIFWNYMNFVNVQYLIFIWNGAGLLLLLFITVLLIYLL